MSVWLQNLLLLMSFSLIVGCERAPSKAQLVGSYSGSIEGVSESLELAADGTFTQILNLPSGEQVKGSGTWTHKYKAVDLDGYHYFYDEMKEELIPPRQILTGFRFKWGADMLIRDWGTGYYTLRRR